MLDATMARVEPSQARESDTDFAPVDDAQFDSDVEGDVGDLENNDPRDLNRTPPDGMVMNDIAVRS